MVFTLHFRGLHLKQMSAMSQKNEYLLNSYSLLHTVLGTLKKYLTLTITLWNILNFLICLRGKQPERGLVPSSADVQSDGAEPAPGAAGTCPPRSAPLPPGPGALDKSQVPKALLLEGNCHTHSLVFVSGFFNQKKESTKKTQDEEIKQIDEERTKQIYKSWKEDSEWQASCEYPEASLSRLVHEMKWSICKALKEVTERRFNINCYWKAYEPFIELQKGSRSSLGHQNDDMSTW